VLFEQGDIRSIESHFVPGCGYVFWGESGLAIPDRFTAIVEPRNPDLPKCHLSIAIEGGRPVCTELRCERRPDGPPLTSTLLHRIPLATYVHESIAGQSFRFTRDKRQGIGRQFKLGGRAAWVRDSVEGSQADRATAREVARRATQQPRRPGVDQDLGEIAAIYRAAVLEGGRPTKAVMEAKHVSRATASRWIARARDVGELGKARPGVAGEIIDQRKEDDQ
jgi:Family of unknown function (DUF6214)